MKYDSTFTVRKKRGIGITAVITRLAILTVLYSMLVQAASLPQTDTYGTNYTAEICANQTHSFDCQTEFSALGDDSDTILWTGEDMILEYNIDAAEIADHIQMVCLDLDADGDLESCVNNNAIPYLTDPIDCMDAFSRVDDLDTESPSKIMVNNNNDYEFIWGSNGIPKFVDNIVADNEYFVHTSINQRRNIDVYQYFDCSDHWGDRDEVKSGEYTVRVVNKKGQQCTTNRTGTSMFYYNYSGTYEHEYYGFNCSYKILGQDIGYCNQSKNFNTTIANEIYNVSIAFTYLQQALNYTGNTVDEQYYEYGTLADKYIPELCYYNLEEYVYITETLITCYNGQLDEELNETAIDYGGEICGYCDSTATNQNDDFNYSIVRSIYPDEYFNINNPFDKSLCHEASQEATSILIIIMMIMGTFVIGIVTLVIILLIANILFTTATAKLFYRLLKTIFNRSINHIIKKK